MEILEKVARAIYETASRRTLSSPLGSFVDLPTWDNASLRDKKAATEEAVAALQEIRQLLPSQEVIDRFEADHCHMSTYHCLSMAWSEMIGGVLAREAKASPNAACTHGTTD